MFRTLLVDMMISSVLSEEDHIKTYKKLHFSWSPNLHKQRINKKKTPQLTRKKNLKKKKTKPPQQTGANKVFVEGGFTKD